MFKFKSLGIIAICALSFTFMSFSSSTDDLYSASYYSSVEKGSEAVVNIINDIRTAIANNPTIPINQLDF